MKAFAVLPLSLLVCACTAKNSAYEKQLARLEENVAILKSERDRLEERIAVLESERDVEGSSSGTEPERPQLQVVALVPPQSEASGPPSGSAVPTSLPAPTAAANEGEARPLLHGSGTDLHQSPGGANR